MTATTGSVLKAARMLDASLCGYRDTMKLIRSAALAGVAKKAYDEARKPHNQQKIKDAVAKVQARRAGSTKRPTT